MKFSIEWWDMRWKSNPILVHQHRYEEKYAEHIMTTFHLATSAWRKLTSRYYTNAFGLEQYCILWDTLLTVNSVKITNLVITWVLHSNQFIFVSTINSYQLIERINIHVVKSPNQSITDTSSSRRIAVLQDMLERWISSSQHVWYWKQSSELRIRPNQISSLTIIPFLRFSLDESRCSESIWLWQWIRYGRCCIIEPKLPLNGYFLSIKAWKLRSFIISIQKKWSTRRKWSRELSA